MADSSQSITPEQRAYHEAERRIASTGLWNTVLDLSALGLNDLPETIARLKSLRVLNLNVNSFTRVPPVIGELTSLEVLNLRNNPIRELPESIRNLKQLRTLSLEWDQLELPWEVRHAQPAELFNYYFAHQKRVAVSGARPLNEAKVLVLGEAEVGKSSLILALTTGSLRQPLQKTHGIIQRKWNVPVHKGRLALESTGTEVLRLNLWDFGGQEIYHSTHTFFLTQRAIYLIVASARDNDRQNNLEYWLQMAVSFGGGAPIWVAVNKCDEHGDGPDEHALQRKFSPGLRGFIRTSCYNGTNIKELKKILVDEALGLDGVQQPMNNIWLSIKNALEETREDIIPVANYLQLCQDKGEKDPTMQAQLLDLWDKLGTVRYFPTLADDPPEMRDTAILNPEWVTKAVYAVLDDDRIREREGLIVESDFERILRAGGYPPGRHRMIEHVMRRFDLLFDTSDHQPHKMLVPQLLPEHQPKIDWPFDKSLRFFYKYPVLPAALVPTFIARMHQRLSHSPPPWRHGCVLEFTGCRALIIGDAEAKQVEINVTGEPMACRDALDAVRFTFEAIHAAIRDLLVEELVPISNRPDAPLLDYRHMRDLEFNQVFSYPAKGAARGEMIMVDVREVLSGVRGKEKVRVEVPSVTNNFYGATAEQYLVMRDHNEINIDKSTVQGNIGIQQTFADCYNAINAAARPEVKRALGAVISEAEQIHPALAPNDRSKLEEYLEALVKTASAAQADKKQLTVSGKGLIEAAKTCGEMAGPIVAATKTLLSLFGGDIS